MRQRHASLVQGEAVGEFRGLLCLLILAGCSTMDSGGTRPATPAGNLVVDGVPNVAESVLAGLDFSSL